MFPSQHSRKAAEIKAMEGRFDFASKKGIKVFENKVQLRYVWFDTVFGAGASAPFFALQMQVSGSIPCLAPKNIAQQF